MLDTSDDALFDRWITAATDATFDEWCASERDRLEGRNAAWVVEGNTINTIDRGWQSGISLLPGGVTFLGSTLADNVTGGG